VYFIACNRALCCSGLRVRVLSTSSQIQVQQVQVAVSLWTIRSHHRRSHGRWEKGIGESGSAFPTQQRPLASEEDLYTLNIQSSRHRSMSYNYTVCLERLLLNDVIFWDAPYTSRSVDRNDYTDSVGKPERNPDINEITSLTLIIQQPRARCDYIYNYLICDKDFSMFHSICSPFAIVADPNT